jgi:hypothetical protein
MVFLVAVGLQEIKEFLVPPLRYVVAFSVLQRLLSLTSLQVLQVLAALVSVLVPQQSLFVSL